MLENILFQVDSQADILPIVVCGHLNRQTSFSVHQSRVLTVVGRGVFFGTLPIAFFKLTQSTTYCTTLTAMYRLLFEDYTDSGV